MATPSRRGVEACRVPSAEPGRDLHDVVEHTVAAAFGPGRLLDAVPDGPVADIHDAAGDLRASHVDPDDEGVVGHRHVR